ncbi:MAG: tyrosine-type recombinase/integrase [Clostridium sp.]|uniref:tyrosine-type recombinase/integrase n=1 Tax=Clostridium sp. TaxID=1506 RepID=UPI0025C6201C|nr:tyrosine-type recombinase/integrase [Clostridium sp.]MCE5222033.1 tyrosine-type recombinase/integrase [Clostridium sp.]
MNKEIPEIVKSYLDYLTVIQGRAKSTTYAYKLDIMLLVDFFKSKDKFKDREFDENFIKIIDLNDLYEFLAYVKNERENNSSTRSRKIATLKSFFSYLETKIKIITYNPCRELEAPKKPSKQINYLTLEEAEQLLSSIDGRRNRDRNFCIITLFLNCGLRLSELCNIKTLDIRKDILVVKGKGEKDRTVYLNDKCISAINTYLQVRPDVKNKFLFLSERKIQLSKRQIQHIVKKCISNANLDTHKYTTHKLRHTAATLLYKHANVDIRTIQAILGHKNIATTTIYTHVDDESVRKAINSNPLNKSDK